jgi:broad specificity phosphatase PhoE
LARQVGTTIGPFDLILASPSPRALETAIAMGFAVDEQVDALGDIPQEVVDEIGHHERWSWDSPFSMFAGFVRRGGATARMGRRQHEAWATALEALPKGGSVLVISHGRVIEAGLVTCVPDGDYAAWGGPFHHCEGVRLHYADGLFSAPCILRCRPTPL